MNERITRFSTHSSSLISKSSVNCLYVIIILFSLSFHCFLIERRRDSGILQCVSLNKLKSFFLYLIIFISFSPFHILLLLPLCATHFITFFPNVSDQFEYASYNLFVYVCSTIQYPHLIFFLMYIFNCFIESNE